MMHGQQNVKSCIYILCNNHLKNKDPDVKASVSMWQESTNLRNVLFWRTSPTRVPLNTWPHFPPTRLQTQERSKLRSLWTRAQISFCAPAWTLWKTKTDAAIKISVVTLGIHQVWNSNVQNCSLARQVIRRAYCLGHVHFLWMSAMNYNYYFFTKYLTTSPGIPNLIQWHLAVAVGYINSVSGGRQIDHIVLPVRA